MDNLNYSPDNPLCSYCGNPLTILRKSFKIEFKTRRNPPIGSKDLNLFNIKYEIFSKDYFVCLTCEAKYDFDYFQGNPRLKAITAIPSSNILLNNYLDNELPKYPPTTTYKVIWRKSVYKKYLHRKSHHAVTMLNKLRRYFLKS